MRMGLWAAEPCPSTHVTSPHTVTDNATEPRSWSSTPAKDQRHVSCCLACFYLMYMSFFLPFLKPSFHCFDSFCCACVLCRLSMCPLDVILLPLVTVYVSSRCYITSFGYCLRVLSMLYYFLWLLSTCPLDVILLPLVTVYVSSRCYITSFGYCLCVLRWIILCLLLILMCILHSISLSSSI